MDYDQLRLSLRFLARQKTYTGINIIGLAIGLACCILLFLYVRDEWRYDRFHVHRDRIYRIATEFRHPHSGAVKHLAEGPYQLAPTLHRELPEISPVVRFFPVEPRVSYAGTELTGLRAFAVDPDVFDMFTFPLLRGDPRTALRQPFSVVITESVAKKYFGVDDPMGKVLRVDDRETSP